MIDHGFGVRLGPLDSTSLEKIREWRNDYAVWRWCRQNDVISDAEQARWFNLQSEDPSIRMYMILNNEEPIGVCGLTSIDLWNRRAEFSLYISPKYQKSGSGESALKTLLKHAFFTLGLNNVWGETFEGNPAISLFDKVGMLKEGTRRAFYYREGKFIDCHLYSILASEWKG